jgi:hypothetical protein
MTTASKIGKAVSAGAAAAIAMGISTASIAAPAGTGNAEIANTAPSQVEEVRHRRWHRRAAVAGVTLGILGAAAYAAHRDRYYHYDDGPYVYYGGPEPLYGDYETYYYAEPYHPNGCWVVTDNVRDQGYQAC